MEQIKSVKTKLYPTASQKAFLYRCFGAERFIFNKLLGKIQSHGYGHYAKDISRPNIPSEITLINTITELKQEYEWLYNTGNDFLQASAKNLFSAIKGFYRGGGYPKFKSRKANKHSLNMYAGSRVIIKDNTIKINGSKEFIKFNKHFILPIEHKITGFTISKDAVGDYWLSITYKFNVGDKEVTPIKAIGCDLGLKETLITSDGKMYARIHLTKKYEQKLTKLQRQHAKKRKGSKNRNKSRVKIAKLHRKIANTRKHNNHCISRDLVNNYNFITLESLQVKNMIKNRKLSKAIQDVAWYQLSNMIKYKQTENQGLFHQIDKWYPSSKSCSNCGCIKDMPLHIRTYECPECNISIDRDINASINILKKGLSDSGFIESEIKELLRNNQELYKI